MAPETPSSSVLARIVKARRDSVAYRKRVLPEAVLRMGVTKADPVRDFAAALTRDAFNVIAELKKASPSRGVLRADFDAATLAAGAVCRSHVRHPVGSPILPGGRLCHRFCDLGLAHTADSVTVTTRC